MHSSSMLKRVMVKEDPEAAPVLLLGSYFIQFPCMTVTMMSLSTCSIQSTITRMTPLLVLARFVHLLTEYATSTRVNS